jgi:hypothetical protein
MRLGGLIMINEQMIELLARSINEINSQQTVFNGIYDPVKVLGIYGVASASAIVAGIAYSIYLKKYNSQFNFNYNVEEQTKNINFETVKKNFKIVNLDSNLSEDSIENNEQPKVHIKK